MAISPKQLSENFMSEVEFYEKTLDAKLVSQKLSPNGCVNLDIPSGMRSDHLLILRQKYINAGWKDVEWNSDQRDGDWLTFKS
jgi:hypothetical protein